VRRNLAFFGASFALALALPGQVYAACTLPNTISNGQVADATKVMGNFTTVAGCADAAVQPSGTPTTGSLATFAGPNSVQTGNLTGDVTTSGGTATTLAASGVTAGSYSSANITVDAKGRVTAASNGSGGGGGSYEAAPTAPPLASTWTWVNQGSSALSDITTPVPGLRLDAPSNGGGDNLRMVVQTPPTTPYSFKARISSTNLGNYSGVGLLLRNSSTGHVYMLGFANSSGLQTVLYSYTSSTGGGSVVNSYPPGFASAWFKVDVTSTTVTFYWSPDGDNWILFQSAITLSSFIGSIDQIGFVSNPYSHEGDLIVYSYEAN